jgi:hypothetical protein
MEDYKGIIIHKSMISDFKLRLPAAGMDYTCLPLLGSGPGPADKGFKIYNLSLKSQILNLKSSRAPTGCYFFISLFLKAPVSQN